MSNAKLYKGDAGAFRALMQQPAVRAATAKAADSVMRKMQAAWPESATESTREGVDVFERSSGQMADGRPAEWVMVNHAYAVAHEARTGFITQSIAASGLKVSRR